MPVTPTYPGVYIEEVPGGVRTIVGVATSVAAFIDFFRRGPLNEAVQIFSFGDFEREFGGLDTRSEASYGIQQFFLNGGAETWVVRVAQAGQFSAASIDLLDESASSQVLRVTAGRRLRGISVEDPGDWGNTLRVEVDYDTVDPTTLFNVSVFEVATHNGRRVVARSETYRNLSADPGTSNNAVEVINEGSRLVQLSSETAWPSLRPAQTGTTGIDADLSALQSVAAVATFRVNPGSGNHLVDVDLVSAPATLKEVRARLQSAIRAANPSDPLLAEATVQLIGNRFRVLAGRSGASFNPDTILTFSEEAAGTLGANLGLVGAGVSANVQQYSVGSGAAGAQSGAVAGKDDSVPDADALRGIRDPDKSGIYALEDVDLFNILCIPQAALLDPNSLAAVVSEVEAYCAERRAFLIIDAPGSIDTVQEAKDWLDTNATLRHRNAALYFPRPRIADPLNNYRLRPVAPSGTIAGLYARTDATRGVWKAPAGTEAVLRNVQQLDYKLTDSENGTLNPLGINCLRSLSVYGNICWGARTLDGADQLASEWKYIPVRRLALFLEESLYRGLKWVVFEPNDEPLWSQIRLNVGAFMHNLFRQGSFQGQTPQEAYFVKCDRETTTQNDINLGIVNIVVGFAPLKPAEFVIIKIQQIAGQIQS